MKGADMFARKQLLYGKKILITGAGSGIGAMTAEALAVRGANLYLSDIDYQAVEQVALRCRAIAYAGCYPSRVDYSRCDVGDTQAVNRMVNRAVGFMNGLDIVFANAGIGDLVGLDGDSNVFDRIMRVNTYGVQNTIDACASHIRASKGYVLVNNSMGGIVILPLMGGGYSPSKAASSNLGQALNLHFIGTGARCGGLYLAEHNTPLEKKFDDPIVQRLFDDNPRLKKVHKKRKPERAVKAVVRGMEHRSLYVHAPRYTVLARYFPAIVNWFVRTYLVQNPQPALEMLRARIADDR